MKLTTIFLSLFALLLSSDVFAQAKARQQQPKKTYSYERYQNRTNDHKWDFSGLLGLYNPGTGFGVRAAYRILDDVLPSADDALAVEAGVSFVGVSDTVIGTNVSYSLIEIPIHARWDFFVANQKMIVGPVAGLNYITASSVTIGGASYSISRSGGVFFQLGANGIYYFTDNLGVQAQLLIGSYTTLGIGINYAL
jgi:hypothetical protein